MIAKSPTKCMKCEVIFCESCLENWKAKKNHCPAGCGAQPMYDAQLSRFERTTLNDIKFKCVLCKT